MPAPIRTVRDPRLSAWQSAVHESLIRKHHREQPAAAEHPVHTDAMAGHPRALGTTAFAMSLAPGTRGPVLAREPGPAAASRTEGLMQTTDEAGGPPAAPPPAAGGHPEPQAPASGQQPAREELASAAAQVTAAATDVDEAEVSKQAVLSAHFYDMAESARTGHLIHALKLAIMTIFWWGIRKYSTGDLLGWATTVTQYIKTYAWGTRKPMYRDWKVEGGGDRDYGVVKWRLPKNARIGIVGDWGTGMPDAIALLRRVLHTHEVDAVLHLGDVYYSGTRTEFRNNLLKVYNSLCPDPQRCPPLYNIPGNHCYYSRGPGFYQTIDAMNGSPDRRQQASYFCLRTEDDAWQFLGMDTGINDRNPLESSCDPGVRESEAAWHLDKLARFPGSTVLLSHHQLFSAYSKVNRKAQPGKASPANVNPTLLRQFGNSLEKVVAWLWGHEHNLVIFDTVKSDTGAILPPGRLIGSSAYEETLLEDPYAQRYPSVPASAVQLQKEKGYYWHGYAIATVGENLQLDYYQFPSSGTRSWEQYAGTEDRDYGFLHREVIAPAGRAAPGASPATPADAQPVLAQGAPQPA
ncbi:MAG TPA: metallophosphoesterase [Longimicrobium sp.]